MKILLVVEAALGGCGRHALDLARGLLEKGDAVHLVYSPLRADPNFLGGLEDLDKAEKFRGHPISITRAVSFSDLSAYWALSRYVRTEGPFDLIHAHSTKAGFLARLLPNREGVKMFYNPHGLMTLDPRLTGIRRRAVSAIETLLAHRSQVVIAVSAGEQACAVESGIAPVKLAVIPNGIRSVPIEFQTVQRARIRDVLGLAEDVVCIGFVSRFVSYKKPERVIEAFAALKQRTRKPCCLVMIGSGPLEDELRAEAVQRGLEKDILFPGQVDGAAYMPAFDVLAHSSLFEGMSYVFLEALSSGVPIVTSQVGGTEELISAGSNGYICDPWNPATFARFLQALVENPELRSAMSDAARARAAQFTVDAMVESVAELYSSRVPGRNSDQAAAFSYEATIRAPE